MKTSTAGQLVKTITMISMVTLAASNLWAGTINAQYEKCTDGTKKTCCSTDGTVYQWYKVKSFRVGCPKATGEKSGSGGVPACTIEANCQGKMGPRHQVR